MENKRIICRTCLIISASIWIGVVAMVVWEEIKLGRLESKTIGYLTGASFFFALFLKEKERKIEKTRAILKAVLAIAGLLAIISFAVRQMANIVIILTGCNKLDGLIAGVVVNILIMAVLFEKIKTVSFFGNLLIRKGRKRWL